MRGAGLVIAVVLAAVPVARQFIFTIPAPSANPIAAARLAGGNTTLPNPTWATAGVDSGVPEVGTVCASLSSGATIAQINTAISDCSTAGGGVVYLGAGTYTGGSVNLRSNVVLRGVGMTTILNFTSDTGSEWDWLGSAGTLTISGTGYVADAAPAIGSASNITTWTGTAGNSGVYTQGATQLDLTSATAYTVGDLVACYQEDEPDATAPKAGFFFSSEAGSVGNNNSAYEGESQNYGPASQIQRAIITAKNGNQITVSPGLIHATGLWQSARTPRCGRTPQANLIQNAGIENLMVQAPNVNNQCTICIAFAHNVWVKGVAVKPRFTSHQASGAVDFGIVINDSVHVEIRDSWLDKMIGGGLSTTTTYGVACQATTLLKIENNIFNNVESPVMVLTGCLAPVIAYNYENYVGDDQQEAGVQNHSVGSSYGLYEGNSFRKQWSDLFHGNTCCHTYVRNHLQATGFSLDSHHRWYNLLGNVITASNVRKSCVSDVTDYSRFQSYGFRMGYASETASSAASNGVPIDTVVCSSTLLWGNYTSTGGTVYDSSEIPTADAVLPNPVPATQSVPTSLYLSEQPDWFTVLGVSTQPWPLIGPDVTGGTYLSGHAYKTPAQLVFEAAGGTNGSYASGSVANFDPTLYGTTWALSCSLTNVQAALTATVVGGTVLVPAGSCSWSGGLALSGKTLRGAGPSTSGTVITAGLVTITKHASQISRLEGFRFTGANQHLLITGTSSNAFFVVKNNYFSSNSSYLGLVEVNGGLFAENSFIGASGDVGGNQFHVTLHNTSPANASWAAAHTMGSSDTTGLTNVYFEDNVITNFRDGFPDVDDGARVVMRYNTITDASIITHGGGSGGSGNDSSVYGARHLEIYNNVFERVSNVMGLNEWIKFRGSSGVVANNTMDNADSPDGTSYPNKREVGLDVGGCSGGHPLQYQVGQSTQAPDATPDAAIVIFSNTVAGGQVIGIGANPVGCGSPSTYIQVNRDYYTSNSWSWTPYTYPHPLR